MDGILGSYKNCLEERRKILGGSGYEKDRALNKDVEILLKPQSFENVSLSEDVQKKIEDAGSLIKKFDRLYESGDFKLTRRKFFLNVFICFLFVILGIVSILIRVKFFKINPIKIFGIVLIIIGIMFFLFTIISPTINVCIMNQKLTKMIESI